MKPVAIVALCLVIFILGFLIGRWSGGLLGTGSFSTSFPADGTGSQEAAAGSATVNASALSPGQRQMLESFGIDADSVVITPEMMACAEAKIGAARIEEIKNGATPSVGEGAMLFACYQGN